MSVASTLSSGAEPIDFTFTARSGPVTRARKLRTLFVYGLICALGLTPLLRDMSASWQAAGIGLWLPGAGFLAVGGWWVLLFPLFIVLFAVAFFAWFGSGMVVAPAAVWLLGALGAGALAGPQIWGPSPYVAAAVTAAAFVAFARNSAKKTALKLRQGEEKRAILPAALAAVAARVQAAPVIDLADRELDLEQLASSRYLLDRALQPMNALKGYDHKDIFQTAALRYQINFSGYALSHLQSLYTPSFHGYLSLAQRHLIDQYLDRKIWGYWVYETMWGHLNFTNFDPAGIDNIMLTGYFGGQVALYQGNTGDDRYAKEGGLPFKLNARTTFRHDVHSVHKSIVDNMRINRFCLYPCEPNWIYPACNFRGMWSLAIYDRVFGTHHIDEFLEQWLHQLDTEFTDPAGTVVPLRSRLTGFALPFLADDVLYAPMGNGFISKRATRYWAIGQANWRKRLVMENGMPMLDVPDTGIDVGNYQVGGRANFLSMALEGAKEFGDEELAVAALNTLDHKCGRTEEGGTIRYLRGSNLTNINIVRSKLTQCGDNFSLVKKAPPASVMRGPVLSDVSYPNVLVARAFSDGEGLTLTLYPGATPGPQRVGLSRLVPGRLYRIEEQPATPFRADAEGKAMLTVELRGRTPVTIRVS